jgi:hypothetical protein
MRREQGDERFESGKEEERFELPHGGAIFGILIGVVIMAIGFSFFLRKFLDGARRIGYGTPFPDSLWPFMIILVGVLIVAGTISQTTQRS